VDSSGQSVILAATFNGIPTSKVFGGVNPNTGGIENDISGHGSQLGSASITITPIPGAVWLLATGLIGLVGIRRKMRQ
jgi:hypothetical protein